MSMDSIDHRQAFCFLTTPFIKMENEYFQVSVTHQNLRILFNEYYPIILENVIPFVEAWKTLKEKICLIKLILL